MALQMTSLSSPLHTVGHLDAHGEKRLPNCGTGINSMRMSDHSVLSSRGAKKRPVVEALRQSDLPSSVWRLPKSTQPKEGLRTTVRSRTPGPIAAVSPSALPPLETVKREDSVNLPSVRAGLKYAGTPEDGGKLFLYLYKPGPGQPTENVRDDERQVDIADVRQLANRLDIDRHGFQLVPLRTALSYDDFGMEEKVKEVYYLEAAEAVKKTTGASRVVVFDHTFRRRLKSLEGKIMDMSKQSRVPQPVDRVHVDYTEKSGPQRLRDVMGEEADALSQKRYSIVQVWRPLKGPVLDAPLAICDASTTGPDELKAVDLIYKDRVGEINYVGYSPSHKWYYAPQMTTDEALVFKCYDSDRSQVARFTPHTGFRDPTTPPDAESRESIEIRTLAFFD